MRNGKIQPARLSADGGFSIVALMVGIAVLMILLGASMPVWHTVVLRDKEEELIFRGEQYVDAIIRFYGKNNRYPLSLDELHQHEGQRFVRQLWKDPMMEDGRWILIYAAHGGPPKITGNRGVGGNVLAASGQRGGGGGIPGGSGPGLTAPAGGRDPFGGGRSGNDPFAGGGGGGGLGGGRGTSPPDGGGTFPGGGFGGGGGLQGPGSGRLDTPGGLISPPQDQSATTGLNTAPSWSSPGATFLHGSNPGNDFGSATHFGQATSPDDQQTHQSGHGSQPGGGGWSGGGSGGGWSGGGGGGLGGGGGGLGGGGGGSFGGGSGNPPGQGGQSMDNIFGQSEGLFGNPDDLMLNPFEGLQGAEDDIQINARPIIGVRSRSTESSIREYIGHTTYDQWIFKVEQLTERRGAAGGRNTTRMTGGGTGGRGAANLIPPGKSNGKGSGKGSGKGDSKKESKGSGSGKGGTANRGRFQLPGGGGGKLPGGGAP